MDTSNLSNEIFNTSNLSEEDVSKLEDMLKSTISFEHKYTQNDEYKSLFHLAKQKYSDMPEYFIEVALFSYLEEKYNNV